MRFVNQIRPLRVGLPILAMYALVATPPVAGWDWNSLRASDDSQAAGGKVRVKAAPEIAPTTPRWSDGKVQHAYAQDGPRADAVQPAAHTGPSRDGTLFGGSDRSGSGPKPPMWRGQSMRMPKKPFSRPGDAGQARIANPSHTVHAQSAPAARGGSNIPAPWPVAGAAAMKAAAQQVPSVARAQAPATARPTTRRQTPTAEPIARPRAVAAPEPRLEPTPEPTPASEEAAHTASTAVKPSTPGDRLIIRANELASAATSEDEYTQILETCRRARAGRLSPPLEDYANQLAAWALNRRGQLKAEAGQTKEAMLDFNDAIRTQPKLWRALHNRGVLKAQTGEFETAFDDFNLTIQFNPKFAKAYSNRAALFVVAGDLQAALDDYRQAIEMDPNLAVAHRGRARVCHQLGQFDEALDHFDAAVQLTPDDAYAVASKADLLTDLGRYVDAAAAYDRAIRLDPQLAPALRGSAWLLATCPDGSVRNAELAIERAELAMKLQGGEEAIGLDTLAAALASAGDFSAAMRAQRQAIEIAPNDETDIYQDRLKLYQRAKPFRIVPVQGVAQVSYQSR